MIKEGAMLISIFLDWLKRTFMNATFISILPDCLSATTNVKCGSAMNKISQRDPDKRTGVSLAVVIEYIMKRLQNYRPAKRIASLIASLTGKIFVKR